MRYVLPLLLVLTVQVVFAQSPTETNVPVSDDAALRVIMVHHKYHPELRKGLRLSPADDDIYTAAIAMLRSDPKHHRATHDAAILFLNQHLSPDGIAKLKAFVQTQKPFMSTFIMQSEGVQR